MLSGGSEFFSQILDVFVDYLMEHFGVIVR